MQAILVRRGSVNKASNISPKLAASSLMKCFRNFALLGRECPACRRGVGQRLAGPSQEAHVCLGHLQDHGGSLAQRELFTQGSIACAPSLPVQGTNRSLREIGVRRIPNNSRPHPTPWSALPLSATPSPGGNLPSSRSRGCPKARTHFGHLLFSGVACLIIHTLDI